MASLTEVTKELQTQTKSLEDVSGGVNNLVKVIQAQIDEQKRGAGDSLEEEIRKRRAPKSTNKGASTFRGGLVDAIKQDTGFNFLGNLARWAFGGLTGALGALGAGGLVASFTPLLGKMVGRLITRGALGSALLLFGEDLFTKAFAYEGIEQYVKIGEEDKKLYAASLSKALTAGLIASIFGKKLGIATFFGSLLADSIRSVFPEDMNWSEKMDLFGLELPFTKESFLKYGAIIGSFFAPSMIRGALRTAFGLGTGAVPKGTESEQRKQFKKGFKPLGSYVRGGVRAVGWGALIAMGGGLLADAIEGFTGSTMAGEITSDAANILGLSAMFGPTGLLVGAIAAFGLAGAKIVGGYFDKKRETLAAELTEKIDVNLDEASAALDKLDAELGARKLELATMQQLARDGLTANNASAAEQNAQNEAMQKLKNLDPNAFRRLEALRGPSASMGDVGPKGMAQLIANQEMILGSGNANFALLSDDQLKNMILRRLAIDGKGSLSYLSEADKADVIKNAISLISSQRMNTGTPLSISAMPNRADYSSFFKSKRREDYDFKQDLKKFNMEIDSLLPPAAAFLGSGGPPSVSQVNNNTKIESSGVYFGEGISPNDNLNGGSFEVIGGAR